MKSLTIATRMALTPAGFGSGFKALGLRADHEALDPYLMVDHYWMSQPTFGAHPHAGFSAVTYMFEDAETSFLNRDSLGDESIIRPGDLHWTIAGSGIVHDEVPLEPGRWAHGLQIFINLAAAAKHRLPGSIHLPRERMPMLRPDGGATVKLVFGHFDGHGLHVGPIEDWPTEASLFDIQLPKGSQLAYPVEAGATCLLLTIRGEVRVADQTVSEGEAVAFHRAGGLLEVASEVDSQAVLLMGQPFNEPVVRQGPFAMSNAADLRRAMQDYRSGRMGRI